MAEEPTINPYAPPASDVANTAATRTDPNGPAFEHPLFSPKQILAAVFFGTVVAGIILLQANFRAMNRPSDAKKTILFGVPAGIVLFGVLLVLPEEFPRCRSTSGSSSVSMRSRTRCRAWRSRRTARPGASANPTGWCSASSSASG